MGTIQGPFITDIAAVDPGTFAPPTTGFVISGTGCSQYGQVPAMGGSGIAQIGTSNFTVEVTNVPSGVPAILFIGVSTTIWLGAIPLPFEMTGLGLPGCFLYQSLDFELQTVTAGGVGSIPLALPNSQSLVGFVLPLQWLIIDITQVPFPLVAVSELGEVTAVQ